MKILRFHTGRGGRFFNQGHVDFQGFHPIQDFNHECIEEGGKMFDDAGNEIDYRINDDGTGYFDFDGEYDTYTFVRENDLNGKQISALLDEVKLGGFDKKECRAILEKYYPRSLNQ